MVQTITKDKLSGSTDGRRILVAATSTPGTTIHTSTSSTTDYDEIWIEAHNTSATDVKITIEWGGTGTADIIEKTIPAEDGILFVVPGELLRNSLAVAVFADTTNVVSISGYIHKIEG